ncbi:P1 family peptidase [Micromonospora zhanjiangensis]
MVGRLADAGVGFPVGAGPGEVVPIVPAAILFDLGRGGRFRATPDAGFGAAAYDAASDGPVLLGSVGAGTGARAGGMKGGIGSASTVLDGGTTVAALVAVNAVGSPVDPTTGELYGARYGLAGEFDGLRAPDPADLTAVRESLATATTGRVGGTPLNTTLAVVGTDAPLTKAQCQKLAGIGHDGLARAIRPVHSMFDGDTVFALSTGADGGTDPLAFNALLAAAGDTVSRAVAHAMLAATGVEGIAGYADLFPGAVRDRPAEG